MRGLIGPRLLQHFVENIQRRINSASTDGAAATNAETDEETANGAENPQPAKGLGQTESGEPRNKQQGKADPLQRVGSSPKETPPDDEFGK